MFPGLPRSPGAPHLPERRLRVPRGAAGTHGPGRPGCHLWRLGVGTPPLDGTPGGGRNVAFSCLKRVAEFYGLWFNELVNGVYKPTYNWNSMVYGRYNELVNGVYKPTYNWEAPSCIEMEIFIAGNIN